MDAKPFPASDEVPDDRGVEVEDEGEGEVVRDLFFDPFLTCIHPDFYRITSGLLGAIDEVEPPRKRVRRQTDQENHVALVTALAANIAYAVVAGYSPPLIAVPMRNSDEKQSRYGPKGLRRLSKVVKCLDEAGVVTLSVSRQRGRASTIEPVPDLVAAILRLEALSFASFGHAEGEETIILARTSRVYSKPGRESELIEYADTAETIRFREEMRRINEHLARADIAYVGPPRDANGRLLDASPRARFLHRTFNIPAWVRKKAVPLPPVTDADKRFDRGGRLYHRGIFWQQLGRDLRRHVRIDGEETAYLDFASMFLRLALLRAGVEPPTGDLYRQIAGVETSDHRDGIKKVIASVLFRERDMERLPPGTRPLLPESLRSADAVVGAIGAAFPALVPFYKSRIGFELTFTESQILVSALLRLNACGITALPIHDGMMVPKSRAEEAKRLVETVSLETVGFALPLTMK
jgi:hypothetical protein